MIRIASPNMVTNSRVRQKKRGGERFFRSLETDLSLNGESAGIDCPAMSVDGLVGHS
jgi:hypothetical protein